MKTSFIAVAGLVVTLAAPAGAQTFAVPSGEPAAVSPQLADGLSIPRDEDTTSPPVRPLFTERSLTAALGHDVRNFFSSDSAKIMATFAIASVVTSRWDRPAVDEAARRLPKGAFSIGNAIGSLYVQSGVGAVTYLIGKTTSSPRILSLGSDLVRAQALSQMFVQGAKFAVGRQRPDGSNTQSFPSGHTATTFATATVLQQHWGWKVGLPAYALAGLVGASRMAADKHYLSDVLVGAGIGIAAGRTVSLRVGRERFAVGAAPTAGGAMVTLTKLTKQ